MPFGFASPSFGENRAEPLGEIQFANTSPPERVISPAEAEFFFHPLRPYFLMLSDMKVCLGLSQLI
jgi:hypothetical protein